MRYLLDTHVLLWWLGDDPKLSPQARQVISDPTHLIFVSAATVWEMSIKQSLGKLSMPDNLLDMLAVNEFEVLKVSAEHGLQVGALPMLHKDPFDRMLITQALADGLTVISGDAKFELYEVPLLAA
ncbi:type II toxin-antitoxin system VapC family toxin [Leptolyngbya sp. PCC 6406]|uniref:type II toxin-antitoxin system VapC family toxin n=1 Tax=Leptolyngbya sp. PCC 6406 TaxID=1173264 RepID=UPI0002ABCC0D|nr:type II toxin-antitoxin system VapC family toxin [Leptolyngbya sp. PCC 6406]